MICGIFKTLVFTTLDLVHVTTSSKSLKGILDIYTNQILGLFYDSTKK